MKISINDYCSWERLSRLAIKCGFFIFEGKKHTKVKNQKEEFITTIPRHSRLKKETAKGIIKALIRAGADIEYK